MVFEILFRRWTTILGCLEGKKQYLRKWGTAALSSRTSRFWAMLLSAQYPWAPSPNFFSITAMKRSLFSFVASKVPAENGWKPEHPELPLSETEAPALPPGPPSSQDSHPTEMGTAGRAGWTSSLPARSLCPPFYNVQILLKCEYRFVFLLLVFVLFFFRSLSWLSGLGNKL